MKSSASLLVIAVSGLMVVAALTPSLIALSHALVPVVIVVGVVVVVLRLVFFHTRKW
jgi:hypothetical protein